MKLDLDCKDVSRLLSDAQEHPPEPSEMARLRLHLVICEACRNVEEQMAFIRRAMQRLARNDPPPPDQD